MDDNYQQISAGLKRNNSDVQAKEAVRQKLLRRGTDFRKTQTGGRAPDLDKTGRVRNASSFVVSVFICSVCVTSACICLPAVLND